jgi:PIN domain nuclease of toxin-antitoxin system
LALPVGQWLARALQPPVQLLPLSPEAAVGSTQLPGTFQRDPADQPIVATARFYDCPLVTLDRLIRAYSHVRLVP